MADVMELVRANTLIETSSPHAKRESVRCNPEGKIAASRKTTKKREYHLFGMSKRWGKGYRMKKKKRKLEKRIRMEKLRPDITQCRIIQIEEILDERKRNEHR